MFSGSHQWHACVEFKHFDHVILIVIGKVALVLKTELSDWTVNEESLWRVCKSVGFSLRAALWFLQWFCLCKVSETNVVLSFNLLVIFTIKSNDSVSFLFLFPCFLFLHQGPNSFFSIKGDCCVFELSVLFVCLFHYVIATKFELQPVQYTAYSW